MNFFNTKWMVAFLLSIGVFFYSCEKEETAVNTANSITQQEAMQAFQVILSTSLSQMEVAEFIKAKALEKNDYDYDVVYALVKDERLSTAQTLEEVLLEEEAFLIEQGKIAQPVIATLPQTCPLLNIGIPVHIESWDVSKYLPAVVVRDNHSETKGMKLQALTSEGIFIQLDGQKVPDVPVIVIGENERMFIDIKGNYVLDPTLFLGIGQSMPATAYQYVIGDELVTDEESSLNPNTGDAGKNCNNPFGRNMYLKGLRSNNLSAYESWAAGAPELRMNVLGGAGLYVPETGANILTSLYEPRKRRDMDNQWWNLNDNLFYWVNGYSDQVWFRWDEEDGGVFSSDTQIIQVKWADEEYSVTCPIFLRDNSDHISTLPVHRNNCFPKDFGSYVLYYKLAY